ncbi:protein kinase domain-containing protein [Planoprotostelium fungivorum]|uniref:Protein kinase domain-containing protein n=1 Tax=Planoprotostelium fungivorum TaxID=1890364 RepID=A0A2P6N6F3_9EUKA|nr:protein kinase domain-containing protein [Planoprotostelium fungivorum]
MRKIRGRSSETFSKEPLKCFLLVAILMAFPVFYLSLSTTPPSQLTLLRQKNISGRKEITISEGLTEFPREIFDLADTLEVLDLKDNALSSLPDDLHRLHRLKILFLSSNKFTTIPQAVGNCKSISMMSFKSNQITRIEALPPNIRWLTLTDNLIEELPSDMGRYTNLQKLLLAGNRLKSLPDTMRSCSQLELMRISNNQLRELPPFISELPKLAWIAFAGNPFTSEWESKIRDHDTKEVNWNELSIREKLGEGASGVVYRADWKSKTDSEKKVAVKVYKGKMTSDGSPLNEMNAHMMSAGHPHITSLIGRVTRHPKGSKAIVMWLLNTKEWSKLARPPSMKSCTRDIYEEKMLSKVVLFRIMKGMASAMRFLHQKGIMHGDLYGHNIVYRLQAKKIHEELSAEGQPMLVDFGAASLYDRSDRRMSQTLEGIEVRAWAILLDELMVLSDVEGEERRKLKGIRDLCLTSDEMIRPNFEQLEEKLRSFGKIES